MKLFGSVSQTPFFTFLAFVSAGGPQELTPVAFLPLVYLHMPQTQASTHPWPTMELKRAAPNLQSQKLLRVSFYIKDVGRGSCIPPPIDPEVIDTRAQVFSGLSCTKNWTVFCLFRQELDAANRILVVLSQKRRGGGLGEQNWDLGVAMGCFLLLLPFSCGPIP